MKTETIKNVISEITNVPASQLKTKKDIEDAILKVMEYTKKKKFLSKKG